MLGLLLLFWIGKYFYKLADKFDKNKWGFAILGIVAYYGGTIIFALLFMILGEVISPGYIDTFNETLLSLLALPFGVLTCYLLYKYLAKTWKKNAPSIDSDIAEIGKASE